MPVVWSTIVITADVFPDRSAAQVSPEATVPYCGITEFVNSSQIYKTFSQCISLKTAGTVARAPDSNAVEFFCVENVTCPRVNDAVFGCILYNQG